LVPAATPQEGRPKARPSRFGSASWWTIWFWKPGIVLFLLASIIDLLIPPFTAAGVPIDLKSLFLIGYFCLLSFNAADYFIDGMRGGFIRKSRELVEALQGRRT
jgi:hypothetical protein